MLAVRSASNVDFMGLPSGQPEYSAKLPGGSAKP